MKNFAKILLLILLLSLASCGRPIMSFDDFTEVTYEGTIYSDSNPAFDVYREDFYYYCKYFEAQGCEKAKTIPVNFHNLGSPMGLCRRIGRVGIEVLIDEDQWVDLSENERLTLIYHELGHCVLNRDHADDKLNLGFVEYITGSLFEDMPHSFMTRYFFSTEEMWAYKVEMFTGSTVELQRRLPFSFVAQSGKFHRRKKDEFVGRIDDGSTSVLVYIKKGSEEVTATKIVITENNITETTEVIKDQEELITNPERVKFPGFEWQGEELLEY